MLLKNLIPIVLFAILIALGLWKFERGMIRGFIVFGKIILIVITIGLAAAVFQELTGVTLIPGMAPLSEGVEVVAGIGFVLAGAFPLVFALTKILKSRCSGSVVFSASTTLPPPGCSPALPIPFPCLA